MQECLNDIDHLWSHLRILTAGGTVGGSTLSLGFQ